MRLNAAKKQFDIFSQPLTVAKTQVAVSLRLPEMLS